MGVQDRGDRLDVGDHGVSCVGVVGLGYVGLPLATGFAAAGIPTVGFDVDAEKVELLTAGRSHIEDVDASEVALLVGEGRLVPTTDPEVLRRADGVFICVPTPFDASKTPDLSYVRAAAGVVAAVLRPGMLVVLQSTTYPGTTTEVVQPLLEATGLKAGVDFDLAFSPERVDPGNPVWNVRNTPKIVGGLTDRGSQRAGALLAELLDDPSLVTVVSSPATAEMAKLLENTYRAVNIALVNELAVLSHEMGIDLWEVIDAAATKPFGFQAFRPGVGPGGHCIPVDPYYLSWKAREFDFQTKFIELAADTNLRMAFYVRGRVQELLNRTGRPLMGSRVLALGASFKPGVGDCRNSRALRLVELLEEAGAIVDIADPFVSVVQVGGQDRKTVDLDEVDLTAFDLVVVLVAHPGWPVDAMLASGVPMLDTVDAIGDRRLAGTALVERL